MDLKRVPSILSCFVLVAVASVASAGALMETKLTPSDTGFNGSMGTAAALDGDTVVAGAPFDTEGGNTSGAAYVFVRTVGIWSQQQKLFAADAAPGDLFGWAVAVSGDTVVVGSKFKNSAAGASYVFVRSGGVWTQQQKLTAGDSARGDNFGYSVAVSGDTAVIGSPFHPDAGRGSGSAYVFERSLGVWNEKQKLAATDAAEFDFFGSSVAAGGDTAIVGAPNKEPGGAAYVFVRSAGTWTQQQKLTASDAQPNDAFGTVAISGDTAAVGAGGDDDHGSGSGSVYVFERSGGVWTQQQKLTASDGAAGDALAAVSVDGNTIVAGASQKNGARGAVYVFTRTGGVWTQDQKLTASDAAPFNGFGSAVSVSADTILAGSPGDFYEGNNEGASPGAVYFYDPRPRPLSPLNAWVGLRNSDDTGIRFDLSAKVYLNGTPVGRGKLVSVGGNSGFTNARLDTIPFTMIAPFAPSSGDTLSIEVFVRNACLGSTKNSGTARVWYNGQRIDSGASRDAGSRFDATIGATTRDYFLRGGFALSTAPGSSRLFLDRFVGVPCAPFASFGTWSTTIP